MSFGYRDRVNRDKPRLSDRFRGKSGEEIVEELRKDFAKRKQMFFDTAPRTSSNFMKPGFPFDDTSRWRNRGDSDLKHRLNEIAQRYPQFATQLRDWTTEEETPSGMGWGSKQAQSQQSAPQQAPSQTQSEAATTTQQPAPPTQTGPEGDVRTQRAMSAPPDNRAKDHPQRFVSRLEINPNSTPGETSQHQPQQQSQPANQQPQAQPQQSAQPEPKKKPSNVRHIPIFVEGRNETVMPRADVDATTADFGTSFGSPPRDRDSRDREDGFHGPAYAKYAPPTFGFMNKPKWRYQSSSPFMSRDPMHGSPPQQHHFPHQQQHPHHSQQQQAHPEAHFQQQQAHPQAHPQQQQAHPPQQQPHPQPQEQAQPEPPRQQTPPRQPPLPKDPLQEVAAVQKDVDELMKQVEAFTGTHKDKQYIYLDEMLTRNLLKLDLVETEGKENVRAARKETIKCIQKCISILESKTMTPEEIAAREKAMEVDPEPTEAQSMEVSPGEETQAPAPADSAAPVPSSTPAPEVPSEPTLTPAPAPEPAPSPMDTSSAAPAAEATPTESKDSNPSSTVNPETPAQTPAQPVAAPESTATAPSPANDSPAETVAPAAAS